MSHLDQGSLTITLTDGTNLTSLAHTLAQSKPISRAVIIDMSDLNYPDVGVLLAVIGWTAERKRLNEPTRYRLPATDKGRELLRRMKFEYGFRSAVGASLKDYVFDADHRYFEREGLLECRYLLGHSDMLISEAGMRLQDRGYFQFRSWEGDDVHPRSRMSSLRSELGAQELRWADEMLLSLLSRRLGRENAGYVGSHIIYEALSNAFRHANSQTIVSIEQVYDVSGAGSAIIRFAFWDNGDPVQETLRKSLEGQENIINPDANLMNVRFIRNTNPETVFDLGVATGALNKNHPDTIAGLDLLLAAFLPGVTSEMDGFGAVYHTLLSKKYPLLAAPGKGLFNMLNATCTFFKGKLTAWSGGQAAIFSAPIQQNHLPDEKNTFSFSVVCEDLPRNDYRGNLIAVELPLHS